jgi:hypothetical protein
MAPDDALELRDHSAFTAELAALRYDQPREFRAVLNARRMLGACGSNLGFPHTSAVRGGNLGLRELRPRAGRSRYRVLYRRHGDDLILLALAPEALTDPQGFLRAIATAEGRLRSLDEPENRDSRV